MTDHNGRDFTLTNNLCGSRGGSFPLSSSETEGSFRAVNKFFDGGTGRIYRDEIYSLYVVW